MGAKKDRRDSQELTFDPDLEIFIGHCVDFEVALEEHGYDERTIQFNKMAGNDDECIQQRARIQAYRTRVIKSIFPILNEEQRKTIIDCYRAEDEYTDTLKAMGDVIMYDLTTVHKPEDKDR